MYRKEARGLLKTGGGLREPDSETEYQNSIHIAFTGLYEDTTEKANNLWGMSSSCMITTH